MTSKARIAGRADEVEETPQKPVEETRAKKAGECVVDDGSPHMGRATAGSLICSRHALTHRSDGSPR